MEKPFINTRNITELKDVASKLQQTYIGNQDELLTLENEELDKEENEDPTEVSDTDNYDYNSDRMDINDNEEDKIVGGHEVDISLYPYQVEYGAVCGGALIDKKWVMTAAHCGISRSYIRAGSTYFNSGRKVGVKKHYIHPFYTRAHKKHPLDYDFQLLELKEPLKLNDKVQTIKIARSWDMPYGTVVTVTGWGLTKENGYPSKVLRAVRVPIISMKKCQTFYGTLTPRMFCAGYSKGKKDSCQGDSGGPAVAYDRLLGVVSFGRGCARPGAYGVYSKVATVRPWIVKTTGIHFD